MNEACKRKEEISTITNKTGDLDQSDDENFHKICLKKNNLVE